MKAIKSIILVGCLSLAFISLHASGIASQKGKKESDLKPNEMHRDSVPAVVTDLYLLEYPKTSHECWYAYPVFNHANEWYGNAPECYGSDNPEYYFVEFSKHGVAHKVIYNIKGTRIATSRTMESDLPHEVMGTLLSSHYKHWKLSHHREEMFRESDKTIVYKLIVERGTQKHALYFKLDGRFIKDHVL
jgi:hypothetical protein